MPTTTVSTVLVAALLAGVVESPTSPPVTGARWDPQWLVALVAVAVVLVGLAVVWWLFLVVRVQDYWRGESAPRRRR